MFLYSHMLCDSYYVQAYRGVPADLDLLQVDLKQVLLKLQL